MRIQRSASRLAISVALVLGGIAGALAPATAQGSDVDAVAALFGARETVLDISLSPSGTKIAFVAAGPEHIELLNVIDLEGDAQVRQIVVNSEKIGDLEQCEWASDTRLVCLVSGMAQGGDGILV
ncbi:MAG: S9 family peptidase, partial [Erythrobacter sp.]|nr:S9 family peptidase [Erythrobacter sp.]